MIKVSKIKQKERNNVNGRKQSSAENGADT